MQACARGQNAGGPALAPPPRVAAAVCASPMCVCVKGIDESSPRDAVWYSRAGWRWVARRPAMRAWGPRGGEAGAHRTVEASLA